MRAQVAVFLPWLAGGGAERSLLRLAEGFTTRYRVDLVLGRADGPLVSQVPPGVRVVALGARRTAAAVGPLARYLRRERPAGMVSALSHANLVAIAARRLSGSGTTLVVSEQSHLTTATVHARLTRDRLVPFLMGRLYPWADRVAAVSEGVADDLVRQVGLDPSSVVVVHNPLLADELVRRSREPLEHPWFGPGQPPVALAVGRLTEQKCFRCLLDALALARQERALRLIILGEGEERPRLEARVRDLRLEEAVDMPGFAANPYPYFAAAQVFVLSSRWEGLPTVLLEALALGVPVVSTDCPSGPREILQGGRLGSLVPVGDSRAMARALLSGVDRRPRPGEGCERYDVGQIVDRYAQVLGLPA